MNRRSMAVLLVPGLCALVVGVGGCADEKICQPGEVAVVGEQGGSRCEPRQEGDRECAAGEILVKVEQTGRDFCIEDRYEVGWQDSVPTT